MSAVQNWLETIRNKELTQRGIGREMLFGYVTSIGYLNRLLFNFNRLLERLNWKLK